MSDFDTELFIGEVEKRPQLYNKNLKEYSDRNVKEKLWAELCVMFIPNFSTLQDSEKKEKGKELQSKWKNLRTCFKKEYNAQTCLPSESGANRKRRKYIYFDQILFLIPTLENRPTTSNLDSPDIDTEDNTDIDHADATNDSERPLADELPQQTRANVQRQPPTRFKQTKRTPTYEESLLKMLKEKREEERDIDEDKYFLLSLLPAFKKFNEEQKFNAKLEIMNVMQRVRLNILQNQPFPNEQPFIPQHSTYQYNHQQVSQQRPPQFQNDQQMSQLRPPQIQNVGISNEVVSQQNQGNQQVSRQGTINRSSTTGNFFPMFNPEPGMHNNESQATEYDESSSSSIYSLK